MLYDLARVEYALTRSVQRPVSKMVLPDHVDLINASYSLPFCPRIDFSESWQNIVEYLAIEGRFSGQLFGIRDAWAPEDSSMTFLTEEQVLQLFEDKFEIEYFHVDEGTLPAAAGPSKYWHVFHVVAKKIK